LLHIATLFEVVLTVRRFGCSHGLNTFVTLKSVPCCGTRYGIKSSIPIFIVGKTRLRDLDKGFDDDSNVKCFLLTSKVIVPKWGCFCVTQ